MTYASQRSPSYTYKSENCFSPTMYRLSRDCSHHSLPRLSAYQVLSLRLIDYKQVPYLLTQLTPQVSVFRWNGFDFYLIFFFSNFECTCLAGGVMPSWKSYDLLRPECHIEYLTAMDWQPFPMWGHHAESLSVPIVFTHGNSDADSCSS